MSEELDPGGARLGLVADTAARRDEHSGGDRVRTLHRAAGDDLRLAELRPFGWMPPNRRGIEHDVGAEEGSDSGRLGIPLVPADQNADVGVAGSPDPEATGLL